MSSSRRRFLRQLLAGSAGSALALHTWGSASAHDFARDLAAALSPEDFWAKVRAQYVQSPGLGWFNTGTIGLMPTPVMEAVQKSMGQLQIGHYNPDAAVRTAVARMVGAAERDIALTRNTTEGLSIVAAGLPLRRGDEVIVTDQEHVGNAVPWLGRMHFDKVKLKVLSPALDAATTLDRLDALVTKRTKVIAVPHITCTAGHVLPMGEIVARYRDRVPYILFDGAHGPGTTALNLPALGCGFYAACGHKWLCGPAGTGFLYIREDLLDALRPYLLGSGSEIGWEISTDHVGWKGLSPTAARFEPGTRNRALLEGMKAAIDFMEAIGWEKVHARSQALADRLRAGIADLPHVEILTPSEPQSSGPILSFRGKGPNWSIDTVKAIPGVGRFRIREVRESGLNAIRISTHIMNSEEEVDNLIDWVSGWEMG